MGKRNVRKIENANKGFVDEVFDVIFYLPRKVQIICILLFSDLD